MKIPDLEILKASAVAHLKACNAKVEAELLSNCKLEVWSVQQYQGGSIGLHTTVRCGSNDLPKLQKIGSRWNDATENLENIKGAIESVLPVEFFIDRISARAMLVETPTFDTSELAALIEAQEDLMISVGTGGPRIQTKNEEYRERRRLIAEKLAYLGRSDPNPFEDLWAWYGRWSSGDLPTYKSRREYIRALYQSLLATLAGPESDGPSEPSREPTGWDKVDRSIDTIITTLAAARCEEEYQTIGLLCRECLISLAQAVYNPELHKSTNSVEPSETDAYRMLEAYFSSEFSGSANEALRRHAKASLVLANELQHRRTAEYRVAALCSEATRTVVNIVAITSGRR
jgi:hypothetical protein